MVALGRGFQVPGRFTSRLQKRIRRTLVTAEADIEMLNGEPRVRAIALAVPGGGRPLTPAELSEISLKDILDSAVTHAALEATPMQWEPGGDGPVPLASFMTWVREQSAADERSALAAARSARDRRRVTPEVLRRVLDIHADKGVQGVMDELNYSERNARRLLARARKELPQ